MFGIKERTRIKVAEEIIQQFVDNITKKQSQEEKLEDIAMRILVEKIHKKKEKELNEKEKELNLREIDLKNKEQRLYLIETGEMKNFSLVQEKQIQFDKEMHEALRKTNNQGDHYALEAAGREHTLKFITWLLKK